jgi:hypothetical protein
VSVSFAAKGQGLYDEAVEWRTRRADIVPGSVLTAVSVELAGVTLLFRSTGTGVDLYRLTGSHSFDNLPAPVSLLTGVSIVSMDVGNDASTVRLFYGNSAGLHYIQSGNLGVSWGSPVTVVSSPAVVADVNVRHEGTWRAGYTSGSVSSPTAHVVTWDGSSWVTAGFGAGWRYVGYISDDWYAFLRCTATAGDRIVSRKYTTGGGFAGDVVRLDSVPGGLLGTGIKWASIDDFLGARMMFVCEGGHGGEYVVGLSAVWVYDSGAGAEPVMDEPILFPGLRSGGVQCEYRGAGRGDWWIVGGTGAVRGVRVFAPDGEYVPTRYVYEDHEFRVEFAASAAPPRGVRVGMVCFVKRGVWDMSGAGGVEQVVTVVYRVEYGKKFVRLLLRDAYGHLASSRLRRPVRIAPGEGGEMSALRALRMVAARCGLEVFRDYVETGEVARITGEAGESLAGVVGRMARISAVLINHTGDDRLALVLIPVEMDPEIEAGWASISGRHPYQASGGGSRVIYEQEDGTALESAGVSTRAWDFVQVADARRYSLSTVVGLVSADPEDGGLVVSRDGPRVEGLRPVAVYQVNRTLYGAAVEDVALAEARRQRSMQIDGWLDTNCDLGAELYDNATITFLDGMAGEYEVLEREYRIVRLREEWERGRLTQRWYLADREWWNPI